MKFKKMTPMIWTSEMDLTIAFYTEILGFGCTDRNDEWGWAVLHHDAIEIMVSRPNEHTPFGGPVFTGSFYFVIEDIDALWELLKEQTYIAYPIEDFDWNMREFGIFDNNGYLLQFGQEILSDTSLEEE
ncbi:MAG: VOC family protein [Saprospiraceae bacterium]